MKIRAKQFKERADMKADKNSYIFEKEGKSIQFYKLMKDVQMRTDQVS